MILLLTAEAWACSACSDSHLRAALPGADVLLPVVLIYILARLLSRPLGGPPIALRRGLILTGLWLLGAAIGAGALLPMVLIAAGLCLSNLRRLRRAGRPWDRQASLDGAVRVWALESGERRHRAMARRLASICRGCIARWAGAAGSSWLMTSCGRRATVQR